MPVTTRYSATFDRPYEEDEVNTPPVIPGARRSRSHSLQAPLPVANGQLKSPVKNEHSLAQRSPSLEGGHKTEEHFPTRTVAKTPVKTHNNPFQFVKVGTSPLFKKAEEQIKKVKETKKPDVVREDKEEEWQSNLDSWKSRRRKMSEDVFKRQEEIKQFELEEQSKEQNNQKKTKTFSEMVESRAHRGRALSLSLIASPLDLQKWETGNNNSSNPFSEESEENSAVNSEDEGVGVRESSPKNHNSPFKEKHKRIAHIKNSVTRRNKANNFFDAGENNHHREGIYIDSGLESISSSHRAGDTPDSCSDFSQDSSSSVDCDSPRASGLILNDVNLLEEFDKSSRQSGFRENNPEAFIDTDLGREIVICMGLGNNNEDFGFSFECIGNEKEVLISSVSAGSAAQSCGVKVGDQIISINDINITSKTSSEILSLIEKAKHEGQIYLMLWRRTKDEANGFENGNVDNCNTKSSRTGTCLSSNCDQESFICQKSERSVESENEVFVDDLETLNNNARKSSILGNPIMANGELQKTFSQKVSDSLSKNISNVQNMNSKNQKITPSKKKDKPVSKLKSHSSEDKTSDSDFNSEETVKIKISKKKRMSNASIVLPKEILDLSCNIDSRFEEASLNIIFQSKKDKTVATNVNSSHSSSSSEIILPQDIPPVEKVAEEMERLILQQLEEEERIKELSVKTSNLFGSPDHSFTAPSKMAEPPKEKPPPPPSETILEEQNPASLKRVNSTKRIKKEIYKRRSNFLGIDNTDAENEEKEELIPPPPALEQILKAEMELDRENMKRLENAAAERLKQEERELQRKEQEIIANLEIEERQKHLVTNQEICDFIQSEEERIYALKEEKQKLEAAKLLEEEQRMREEEDKQLKEREEFVRQQEVESIISGSLSAPLLSNSLNTAISLNASLSSQNPFHAFGDGKSGVASSFSSGNCETNVLKPCSVVKPIVPPKPLKKKEAIRKERERLRQEQEELQRAREEHRRKMQLEQEKIAKTQPKLHAPDALTISPLPHQSKLTSQQLTTNAQPVRSHHFSQNTHSSSAKAAEPTVHIRSHPSKIVSTQFTPIYAESWQQQKVHSVKKQPHPKEPTSESKYNQNHWLIQEAEMRRIAEQRERQLVTPQTHLAEDEVCSNVSPPQDAVSPYGLLASMPIKKYPPPITHAKPTLPHSREMAPPAKPSRVIPLERQEQMLSVSGRKRCSHCNEVLGRGAAMIIESLQLCYHIQCFQCCVCQSQLGNGSCGTDVRVRNSKLHCHNCYSNDEAGLKFSQV